MSDRPILRTVLLSLAIVLAGLVIGGGIQRFRLADRSVTVKGVAERDVRADIALWPMRIVASGTELGPTQDKLAADQLIVRRFLASRGIDSSHVELLSLEVVDKRSNPYEGNPNSARFAINATLVARSEQPERIRAASQDVGQLVAAGVALSMSPTVDGLLSSDAFRATRPSVSSSGSTMSSLVLPSMTTSWPGWITRLASCRPTMAGTSSERARIAV